jgi:phosphatidylglycerophosphate synthase
VNAAAVTSPSPPGPGLVNIANVLTVVRILLVPVFVACLFAVVREVVMAVAVVVTLVTGANYVVRAVRLYRVPAYGQDGGGADG